MIARFINNVAKKQLFFTIFCKRIIGKTSHCFAETMNNDLINSPFIVLTLITRITQVVLLFILFAFNTFAGATGQN